MELEDSLKYSKDDDILPYPDPDQSSSCPFKLLEDQF